jgi:hypothetical protein
MTSAEPRRQIPPKSWKHLGLLKSVKEAIYSLPSYFRTETNIEGINATDIFTFNTALGATIENQVIQTLNQMRSVWDPDEEYVLYSFVRQSQTFPDVLLKRSVAAGGSGEDIIMGIELKGWYFLAKEGVPSFRFQVTPAACGLQDLIVVVPWVLNNVISGSPRVLSPYIESARYAAEYRNYHWENVRDAKDRRGIKQPSGVGPYPAKSDRIADTPESDAGGNFGRYARTGLMDDYLERTRTELLCGIQAEHWLQFFKIFRDQKDTAHVKSEIDRLKKRLLASGQIAEERISPILAILDQLDSLASE